MSTRSVLWLVTATICAAGPVRSFADVPATARVLKHTSSNGDSSFAVILKTSDQPKGTVVQQHVIVVDTSASQVGEHRQQSIAVLASLLKSLPETSRVRLFAADLRAEPLDDGFHNVKAPEVTESIELLKARVPLGATNLEGVLRTVMQSATDQPTDITYIGDGLSTADLVEVAELRALVSDLRERRIRVHSFAVGPQRNLQIFGILAQQTGGYVSFDAPIVSISQEDADKTGNTKSPKTKSPKLIKDISRVNRTAAESASEQGKALATALSAPVFFPTEIQVTPTGTTLLPSTPLPIRMDRETIYLAQGSLPANAQIKLTDTTSGESLEWKLAAHVDQPGATFLPVMIDQLKENSGFTNSLAGMTLFLLAQSDFADNINAMAERAGKALQLGDIDQAAKLSAMISDADPNNEIGKLLQKAIEQAKTKLKPAPDKPNTSEKPRLAPIPAKSDK